MKVQASILVLLTLSACASDYSPMWQQVETIDAQCLEQRKIEKLKTAVQYTDCMEEASMPLYIQYQYPYTDVMKRYYLKHRVISEKLDNKKITKAEANSMVADLKMETTNIVQQGLDRRHQRDREFIQDLQASKPVHCNSYSNYGHTNTTCY